VFLISWRNADAAVETATWENYVDDAVVRSIHIVQEISKQPQINALGFCVGGTILSWRWRCWLRAAKIRWPA
jgi:polyhydroxyalkanoate synthase